MTVFYGEIWQPRRIQSSMNNPENVKPAYKGRKSLWLSAPRRDGASCSHDTAWRHPQCSAPIIPYHIDISVTQGATGNWIRNPGQGGLEKIYNKAPKIYFQGMGATIRCISVQELKKASFEALIGREKCFFITYTLKYLQPSSGANIQTLKWWTERHLAIN